jgi:hypothetical protein
VQGQQVVEVVLVEGAVGASSDVDDPSAAAPGQVVRVVLQDRGEHDGVVGQRQRAGQAVDGLGRVLAEDDDVALGVGSDELTDDGARLLVHLGAQPRLVAGAAVDAGIER